MASVADERIIELAGVGQRTDRFTLELVATDRTPLGVTLKAHADSAPQIQVNTTRTSIRTCSGVIIEDPPLDLNLDRTRVMPVLTLANGSRWPLGVLMFGTDTRRIFVGGNLWTPDLFDENFLLDQDLPSTWTVQAGQSVLAFFGALVGEVLGPLGVPTDYRVADVAAASPLSFKVGSSRLVAAKAVAALLGALPPYFANDGTHTLKPAPAAGAQPDHVYAVGTRIFDGTTSTTSSRYKAPNRYIVTGDDIGSGPVRGVYDLPPASPNSYFVRGQIITAPTHVVSGVTDPALAAQIAYVDALTDDTSYGTVTWSAAADPRHDTFDTVELLGEPCIETGWTLTLTSGGEHVHNATRTWATITQTAAPTTIPPLPGPTELTDDAELPILDDAGLSLITV